MTEELAALTRYLHRTACEKDGVWIDRGGVEGIRAENRHRDYACGVQVDAVRVAAGLDVALHWGVQGDAPDAVVGTGRIGQALILKAVGLDVNILCHDPVFENHDFVGKVQQLMDLRHRLELVSELRTIRYVSLEEALAGGDYLSLHVPLLRPTESATPTYHLINSKTLRLMKPTAYLVNTSRGPVVDEAALADALKQGVIQGAALDVFEKEPLPADSPLRDPAIEERMRLFPHFASAGRITRLSTDPNKGMAGRCVQAVMDVLEGNYGGDPAAMPYVVNKEAFKKD